MTSKKCRPFTHDDLLREVRYDPATGTFVRIKRSSHSIAGSVLTTPHRSGYLCVGVFGRQFLAHRLAIFYMSGKWPRYQVDHKNGIRSDNRFSNLREVSQSQNAKNHGGHPKRRISKYRGVRFRANSNINPWRASIMVNRLEIFLGSYPTEELAFEARLAAEREYCGEFAVVNSRGQDDA